MKSVVSIDQLIKASDCLSQQLTHFRGNAEVHQEIRNNGAFPAIIRNALILSFALHFRNIYDFFYLEKSQKDDVLAEHFFDDPSQWRKVLPQKPESLIKYRIRLNKHLAHITYVRINQTPEDRVWDFQEVMESLMPVIITFVTNVDQRKLHSSLHEELNYKVWKLLRRKPNSGN